MNFLFTLLLLLLTPVRVYAAEADVLKLLKELKQQQADINAKIAAIEKQIEQDIDSEPVTNTMSAAPSVKPAEVERLPKSQAVSESIAQASPRSEPEKSRFIEFKGANTSLTFGGAFRVNGSFNSESSTDQDVIGNSGFDLFRLDVNTKYNQWELDAQYRWYEFMNTIHHGYIAYNFSERENIQFGITHVPFGLLPYASHSFWFSQGYYLGLEDDYDMGIKYYRESDNWQYDLAFFKNEERNNATNSDRYSFDLVRSGMQQNQESNQINARVARKFVFKKDLKLESGLSLAAGQVYNDTTEENGNHWRGALHFDLDTGPWEFQTQASHYKYNLKNPVGVSDDLIQLGAFSDTELVAAEGTLLNFNIAHDIDVSKVKALENMKCYNDYSYLIKHGDLDLQNSQMNVLGCSYGIGPIHVYTDWILGKNAPFIGTSDAFGASTNTEWNSRLNINVGWYF